MDVDFVGIVPSFKRTEHLQDRVAINVKKLVLEDVNDKMVVDRLVSFDPIKRMLLYPRNFVKIKDVGMAIDPVKKVGNGEHNSETA